MPSLLLFGGGGPPPVVTVTAVNGGSSAVVEKRGGSVVTITGTNFDSSAVVEVILGAVPVGTAVIVNAEFDLSATQLIVGLPAMEPETLHGIRVTTNAGAGELANALFPVLHAEESKVHIARRNFSENWAVGPRILVNNLLDLGNL